MKCKCGFDMRANIIDPGVTVWRCPLGHKKTIVTARPSASHPRRQLVTESTYPDNLEHK